MPSRKASDTDTLPAAKGNKTTFSDLGRVELDFSAGPSKPVRKVKRELRQEEDDDDEAPEEVEAGHEDIGVPAPR